MEGAKKIFTIGESEVKITFKFGYSFKSSPLSKNQTFLCCFQLIFEYTVKPVYNDHPRETKFVAVVDRWSLFRGSFIL